MPRSEIKVINGINLYELRRKVLEMALQVLNSTPSRIADFSEVEVYFNDYRAMIIAERMTPKQIFHHIFGYFCPNCNAKVVEATREFDVTGSLCKKIKDTLCCESCGWWTYKSTYEKQQEENKND